MAAPALQPGLPATSGQAGEVAYTAGNPSTTTSAGSSASPVVPSAPTSSGSTSPSAAGTVAPARPAAPGNGTATPSVAVPLPVPTTTAPAAAPSPTGAPNPSGRNLALDGGVRASSAENAGAFPPSAVVDGNTATRWSSVFLSDPQWIAVDLGRTWQVSSVRLRWEFSYAVAYRVEVSADEKTWRTVYSTRSGNGGTDDIQVGVPARHVRVTGTTRYAERYGYSLYEFEVR